jgi:hypothetical protein
MTLTPLDDSLEEQPERALPMPRDRPYIALIALLAIQKV